MEVQLKAEPRTEAGKGPARRLRASGKVPAVVYGPEVETQQVAVDERQLWHALHTDAGANVLINLAVDGETYLTLPREIQRDIVRGTLMHVDFLRIRRDVAIQVDVPIHLVGESVGVKEGGVVEHHLWELKVEVLPTDVPESLEADISALAIGDSLHVSDIVVPENVTVITPPEETLVSVVPPPVLVVEPTPEELEAAEAAEAAAAEGEVPEGEEGAAPAAEGEAPAEGEQAASEEGGEKKGS
ncbi:MAG TPA: 50S ribosomal protein L25/general stress protein Ctc [Actinomycetota bacterium]|nr:50S ribosomal protein L25/general stress protein Ctc [Actinomycetota bacterium]